MPLARALRAVLQPHYLYRPGQILRRIHREWFRTASDSELTSVPWGHSLRVNPTEVIGRRVWLHGIYGLNVCELLWRLSEPGMTVVDGGANIGVMTSLCAHRTDADGTVYAFEPHPALYPRLAENVRRVRSRTSTDVYPLPFALHRQTGYASLAWNDAFSHNQGLASLSASTSSTSETRVACTTLDTLFPASRLHILKLDVEGHEANVLAGATSLLKDGRIDHVVYECHEGADASLHDRLLEHGYTPFAIGSRLTGPSLLSLDAGASSSLELDSSFLATRHPHVAQDALGADGWHCLTEPD